MANEEQQDQSEARAQQVIFDLMLNVGDEMRSEGATFPTATAVMTEVSKRAARALSAEGLLRSPEGG